VHIAADRNSTMSRPLRQECDDIVEISAAHLRPFVDLIAGAEPADTRHRTTRHRTTRHGATTRRATRRAAMRRGATRRGATRRRVTRRGATRYRAISARRWPTATGPASAR
jgi:hypothetical protein